MKKKPPSNASGKTNESDADRNRSGGPGTRNTRPREIGGPRGPEPTRYGDWERKGRCIDF